MDAADLPVPRDYAGDGRADVAVYRSSAGMWIIRQRSDDAVAFIPFGLPDDRPVPADDDGDGDGDGHTDIAVHRPAEGTWLINGLGQLTGFGGPSDVPLTHP